VICSSSTPYEEQRGCFKESGGGGDEENSNYTAINTF
jgi:hypothetical protein